MQRSSKNFYNEAIQENKDGKIGQIPVRRIRYIFTIVTSL